jgi:hypothetical protein
MSAPNTIRSQYSDLFGSSMLPVLEEIFRTRVAMHPSRREALFATKQTDRDIWQSTELHDMELFNEMAEGIEYNFKRAKQGASKTFSVKKMGLGFSISREAIEDGKVDLVREMTEALADSAMESKEVDAMNVFNNGFSTETCADGVALFSTSHTLPSGGTFRSKLSADADLSYTSLAQAITDLRSAQVGDSGIIKLYTPKILLVHDSARLYAKELVGSELKVDTSNNNLNPFKDEGIVVISSPHLTDTDAWFLLSDKEKTGLRIINRQGIQTKSEEVFDTDSVKYKASYRERLGAIHAYGVMGTAGA